MMGGEGLQLRNITTVLALCLLGIFLFTSLAGAAEEELSKQTVPAFPTAKDKCPVCGMFVAKYPDWTMVVLFKDGSHVFFDGAKDMFKYIFNLKRYAPARKAEDIKTIMVKDYYRLSWIDAQKAWFVLGSDVYGPMGRELIPLEKETDAKEFMKDHHGKKILRFADVTAEVIKTLDY
jgi:copper chaperone NosL